jgi:hypothetical protein
MSTTRAYRTKWPAASMPSRDVGQISFSAEGQQFALLMTRTDFDRLAKTDARPVARSSSVASETWDGPFTAWWMIGDKTLRVSEFHRPCCGHDFTPACASPLLAPILKSGAAKMRLHQSASAVSASNERAIPGSKIKRQRHGGEINAVPK